MEGGWSARVCSQLLQSSKFMSQPARACTWLRKCAHYRMRFYFQRALPDHQIFKEIFTTFRSIMTEAGFILLILVEYSFADHRSKKAQSLGDIIKTMGQNNLYISAGLAI